MAFDTLCFLPFLSRRKKRGYFKKLTSTTKSIFFFFLKHRSCLRFFIRWVFTPHPMQVYSNMCGFHYETQKVTTNPRDTIFWITDHNFFLMNVFPQKLVITSGSWHKKIIKIEGQRCPFEPPNRGLAMKFKRNWKP